MSPLGQYLSNWLQSGPGMFTGATADEALAKAHTLSGLHPRLTLVEFKEALDRVGYKPIHRTITNVWVLALPEKFKGF